MTTRTIQPKTVREFPEYLDFEPLRSEGIKYIQELAGDIWTDHNSHDPGITLLEVLCYALTDLGYRTNLDIHDLFAANPDAAVSEDDNFSTAARILSCNPLTILDFRKLLIDLDGVRNAWFVVADGETIARAETGLSIDVPKSQIIFNKKFIANDKSIEINGLYKILLELDDIYLKQEAAKGLDATGDILSKVHETVHAHRNLCEDFLSVQVLRDERISLCADIELSADASPEAVMLSIFEKIQAFLSPDIPFYTLRQMLDKGATTDQIFEGRPLRLDNSHGFIDADELTEMERRNEIHVSDIYRLMLCTEGVVAVKKLRIINLTNSSNREGEEWLLPLTPDSFRPVLDAVVSARSMNFTKRDVAYIVDSQSVIQVFEKKLANRLKVLKQPYDLDLPIPLGNHRSDLGEHYSIQNDLPATYGTTKTAFPTRNSTPEERIRQAQALQLKGYMLFFDRLLANYLEQLAQIRQQFSPQLNAEAGAVAAIGSLSDVPFLNKLLPYDNNEAAILRGAKFEKGETIAKVIDPKTHRRRRFSTPQALDAALQQIMADFDADNVHESFPKAESTGLYHFQVESQRGRQVVLRSKKRYATEDEARAALGSVRFLATLESSYVSRLQRPITDHYYTFDWVFQVPDFQQFMREITESRTDYFSKKNQLFDHLLGRFAEDFTDYTLLMFGMYKNSTQQPDIAVFAKDKARFIAKYPEISRNRAKGFDQKAKPIEYWKGVNISGVENRLATMLDFNRRGNKQLNFFEVVADDRVNVLLNDRRGITILHSEQSLHPDQVADFQALVNASAKLPDAFEPYEHKGEKQFGFRLRDKKGCIIAYHPFSYATAEARDNALHYTRLVARDDDRLPVEFVAKTKGFYAHVQTSDEKAAFKATQAAATESDAQAIALQIRRAATKRTLYEKFQVPSQGFTFGLRPLVATNDGTDPPPYLAIHPLFYQNETDCDAVLDKIHRFFKDNPLKIVVSQLPQRHRWSLATPEGEQLESLHFFKTLPQTRAAARLALQLATKTRNYDPKINEDGTVYMHIVKRETYPSEEPNGQIKYKTLKTPIAVTKPFASLKEAEAAIGILILLAQTILQKIDNQSISNENEPEVALNLETAEGVFKAVLYMPDGSIGLADVSRHLTADAAEINFYNDLQAACAGFWHNESVNNGCAKGFNLANDADLKTIIAEHPNLYTTVREREKVQETIKNWVCDNRAHTVIEPVNEAWQFQLVCLDYQGKLAVILRGLEGQIHQDEASAQTFFEEKVRPNLLIFNDNQIEKTEIEGGFSFNYLDGDKNSIAEHPMGYATEKDRDKVIDKLENCLQTIINNGFVIDENVCKCLDIDGKERTADRRRWRVRDEQVRVAVYQPQIECANVHDVLKKIAQQYACRTPQYSNIVVGDGAIINDGLGSWQWIICNGKKMFWQSAGFDSKEKARADFESQLMPVMMAARDLKNYQVRSNINQEAEEFEDSEKAKKITEHYFILELLNDDGKLIAGTGKHFCQMSEVFSAIAKRHDFAILFPLIERTQGIYFQIFNHTEQNIVWRSAQTYDTWQTALEAFDNFIDMLGFESHYRVIGDEECGCQIALTEVLLESSESFFTRVATVQKDPESGVETTTFITTDSEANAHSWRQVENFLDAYQAVDASQLISIYTSEADGRYRYRWQLVGADYALARHPKAFHTAFENGLERDVLFGLSQNIQNPQLNKGNTQAAAMADDAPKKISEILDTLTEAQLTLLSRLDNYFIIVERDKKGDILHYLIGVRDAITGQPTVFEHEYKVLGEMLEAIDFVYSTLQQSYIVPRVEGGFGFEIKVLNGTQRVQLMGLTETYPFSKYEVIWESVKTYQQKNGIDLDNDYQNCLNLIKNKANYIQKQAADGSMLLLIRNPAQILASSPRRYLSRTSAQKAAERALTYVDTEGLHLIEHVLLRPRHWGQNDAHSQRLLMPIQVTEAEIKAHQSFQADDDFKNYIIGGDPYSMTATVILPYWSRRFRNVDFRRFFENTLRREMPVHIWLNIFWISPEQMQAFERQWRRWLNSVNDPNSSVFVQNTACLLDVLRGLKNTFPLAVLSDCGSGIPPVILDETTIG